MKNYTDITILLDRSGSMAAIKPAMESALDEFMLEHRKTPSTRISLVQFDDKDDQDVVYNALPVSDVPKTRIEPRGWTPLLDALCKCIDKTGDRLRRMSPSDRPNKVLMIVITDGQENMSKTFKRDDVRKRVRTQEDNFQWEFVYLGANQDAYAEAASFGIKLGSTLTYGYNSIDTMSAIRGMSVNTSSFAGCAENGTLPSFTNAQKSAALEVENSTKKKGAQSGSTSGSTSSV